MNRLANYNLFLFEQVLADIEMVEVFNDADILESIVTDSDALLKSIAAEEVDLFTTFHVNPDHYDRYLPLEKLYDDERFNKSLQEHHWRKNELESSEETETFLDKTIAVKFFSVYKDNQSELEQPQYIVFQSKPKGGQWSELKCYKVREDMKNFYQKLTTKTVEIKKDGKTYIYNTSNSGNDWNLQNSDEENDTFQNDLTSEDIRAILKDKNTSITILA